MHTHNTWRNIYLKKKTKNKKTHLFDQILWRRVNVCGTWVMTLSTPSRYVQPKRGPYRCPWLPIKGCSISPERQVTGISHSLQFQIWETELWKNEAKRLWASFSHSVSKHGLEVLVQVWQAENMQTRIAPAQGSHRVDIPCWKRGV